MQRKHAELLVIISLFCIALGLIANQYYQQALQDRLFDAVTRDDAPTVIALLDRGVNPVHHKPVGMRAIDLACAHQAHRTLRALLQRGAKPTAEDLYNPALADDQEMVEMLLQAGANPNVTSWNVKPLVMELVVSGRIKMLKRVLAHGADPNIVSEQVQYRPLGFSALMAAVMEHHPEAAQLLLDAGANVDARIRDPRRNIDGYSCLMLASSAGQTEAVKMLLAHHADVNIVGADGQTALRLAQNRRSAEITALLMQAAQQSRRSSKVSRSPSH